MLAVDSNYRGLQQSDQQTTSIQRERDSLNKLRVEILGPIIHCPLKEMKEIKEKKRKIVNIYINLMVGTTLFQPIHIQGGGGKE